MPEERRARLADALLGTGMLAVSVTVLIGAAYLPPPLFDPLGPGSFPKGVAGLLAFLSVILLARTALGLRVGRSTTSMISGIGESADHRPRPWLAVALYLLVLAYVALIWSGALGFLVSTVLFVGVLGYLLSGRTRRDLAIACAVAVAAGGATWLLFSKIFAVQWP